MARRTIASENRVGNSGNRFPKLEFKNKGEYHRVLLFQKDDIGQPVVWQEYVHVLRVPKFDDDNMPKMVLRDSKRAGSEDEKYQDYDTDWLGTPLCLGDPSVIETEGYDAANCPACQAVEQAPAEAKLLPQLAFACNVVEYALAPGTWQVQRPLSAKVVIWRFSAGTYDDIISQQEQHGELVQKQDLTLEVVNAGFRQAKIGVMAPSGWQETPGGAAYLTELLGTPGNIATDDQLRSSCGREAKRIFMQEDVSTCVRKWRKAKAALNEDDDPAADTALGGGQPRDLAAGIRGLEGQDSAQVAQQVAALRDQTRAEVSAAVQGDPFAAAGQMAGWGEFTPEGNHQNQAEAAHAAAMAAPSAADPFAAAGVPTGPAAPAASAPPASTPTAPPSDPFAAAASSAASGSPAAAASAAPATSPTAPQHSDPFAAAQPPATGGEGKSVSFDEMIASLGGSQG